MSDKRSIGGRPALYGEPVTKRVEVLLTTSQRTGLQRVADATGTGISSVIRELIDGCVERSLLITTKQP